MMAEELRSTDAPRSEGLFPTAISTEVCTDLPITPTNSDELYRYLGYPRGVTPAPRMAERIAGIVAEALPCLRPRGAYAIYAVKRRSSHSLDLGDATICGNIGEYLEQADRIAVFVVTVGKEISCLAESAADSGDSLSAWVADAVGSWAVESTAEALMVRIRSRLGDGEALTLRYSPGNCGMDIGEQRNLFHLVQAESVGVTLLPSMLMVPLKSISGLIGLAPQEAVSLYRSPCDHCARTGCHMRR